MTQQDRQPSSELLAARRALEGMSGIALLRDWVWYDLPGEWVLHCQLSLNTQPESPIPSTTNWYVLVNDTYPWGSIKFYPAKENGILQTFPHESYNTNGTDEVPWRTGDICLDTSVHALGRHGYDSEPYGVHERLRWRFQRAIEWLSAAARGELVLPGEPFELPQIPVKTNMTVIFSEGRESFATWQSFTHRAGMAELVFFSKERGLIIAKSFRAIDGIELLSPRWGKTLSTTSATSLQGIWLRLPGVPVLSPWQAPTTWGDLRQACQAQGIDIDDLLKTVVRQIRDGRKHIALIGYPIAERVGEAPCQIHWQAVMLPELSWGTNAPHGFRANEKGFWHRDRTEILRGAAQIDWLDTENWHSEQISTRGKLSPTLISKRILLLGAGAVGSALAEMFVRAGIQVLTIVDGDTLAAGNLVRHTLGMDQIGLSKARSLADRLDRAAPHVSIESIESYFPPLKDPARSQVLDHEVIVDCTGNDEVLHHLELFPWDKEKWFLSISLGLQARRLFLFASYGSRFSHAIFVEMIEPWLAQELDAHKGLELPREGIGCWHPVFPARTDDIWMLAAIAVKRIESIVLTPLKQPKLIVFEQRYEDDVIVGVDRIYESQQDAQHGVLV